MVPLLIHGNLFSYETATQNRCTHVDAKNTKMIYIKLHDVVSMI